MVGSTHNENSPFSNNNPYSNMIGSGVSQSNTPKVLFTINHVEKKTKGFVDFDLQIRRPEIAQANAHD